jgi:hypothetical protein
VENVLLPVLINAVADEETLEGLVRFGQRYREVEAQYAEQTTAGLHARFWIPALLDALADFLKQSAHVSRLLAKHPEPGRLPLSLDPVGKQTGKLPGS